MSGDFIPYITKPVQLLATLNNYNLLKPAVKQGFQGQTAGINCVV
jgi:hypothetical protein